MWKLFKKHKPSKNGWYECTVEVSGQQRYVMDLYWYSDRQQFRDNRRQDVFNSYDVLDYKKEKMYTSDLCNRTESVIAWRKQPKPYMKGFVKKD